jgi:hypothetical protein
LHSFSPFPRSSASIFQNIVLRIERYHSVAILGFAPCFFTPLELMFFYSPGATGPRSETIRTPPTVFVLDTPGIRATTTRYPTNRVVAILMASAGLVILLLSSVQAFSNLEPGVGNYLLKTKRPRRATCFLHASSAIKKRRLWVCQHLKAGRGGGGRAPRDFGCVVRLPSHSPAWLRCHTRRLGLCSHATGRISLTHFYSVLGVVMRHKQHVNH